MPIESIPVTMGGKLPVESWSYDFDTKSGGLFCPDSNHVDLDEVHLRNEHKLELEKNMLAVAADNSTSTGMKNSSEKNVSVLSKGMKASSKLLLRLSGSEKVTSPLGYQELSTRSITEIQLENMKIIYRKNVKSFDQDAGSSNGTAKSSSEKQSTIVHIPSAFNGIISSVPNTFHSLFHFNVQHSQGNSTTTSLASSPNKQSMQASRNTNLKNVFDTEKTSNLSTNESVSEINRRTRIHHLNDKNNQYHHHHHHEFAGVLHTSCLAPKSDQNTSNSIDPKRRKSIAGHKLSSDEQSSFSKSAKDATPTKGDNSPKIRPFTTSLIGLPPLKLPGLFSDHHNSSRNSNSDSSPSVQQHTDNSPTTIHNSHFPEYPPRKSISSVSAVFGFGTKTHSGTGNGSVVDVSDNQSESTMSEAMYLIPHADSDDAHSDTHSITSTSHDEVHVSGRVTRPVPHHGKIGPTGSLSSLFESVTTKPTLGSRGTSNSSGGSMNARVHYHLSESASIHEPQSLEMNPNIESSVQQSSYSEPISSHISPKQYSDQSTQTDMTIPAVGNALIVYDFQSLGTSLTVLLSMSPMVTLSAVAIGILSYYGHNFFATLILIFVSVYGIYIAISY